MSPIIEPSGEPNSPGPGGFGPVPTLGGNVATVIPDNTGSSPTQAQQAATASTLAAAQAIFLPPAPTQVKPLRPDGGWTLDWVTWFQKLQAKMGGYNTVFLVTVSANAPITGTGIASDPIKIHVADVSNDGYLSKTDWATFNGKQDALNGTGLVRMSGTAVTYDNAAYITSVSATAPITGNGTSGSPLAMAAATGSVDGYLSASAQTIGGDKTFNGKVGFNGTAAIAKPALNAAAVDAATNLALTNQIRAALIAYGLCS